MQIPPFLAPWADAVRRFFTGRSLAFRLVASAAVWSLVVLAAAGWGLSQLYRESVMRQLDASLSDVVGGLVVSVEPTADGGVQLTETPRDPRFASTFSGRYWQMFKQGADGRAMAVGQSASLWDFELKPPADLKAGEERVFEMPGPDRQRLRLKAQKLDIQGAGAPVVFVAASDRREADNEVNRFTLTLLAALTALAAGLIAAVVIQVRVALAPLGRLQADVAEVRRGRAAQLEGDYPSEVAPLAVELNKLLDHNREVVERARTHVGNLAHALKTPISVLLNEARASEGPLAKLVAGQAEGMASNIDHYLRRAQAAARAETLGARAPVKEVLDNLARMLERLYGRQKDLEITVEAPVDAVFRGEKQDLEEMAGNLMENACKYGGGQVLVTLRAGSGDQPLEIIVDDDGPGLSPDTRARALKRGERLDESTPGQGLGLSIAVELAALYGGALALEEAELGGLRARLSLPVAE
jgi:signal transduction histidine kinase